MKNFIKETADRLDIRGIVLLFAAFLLIVVLIWRF